MPKLIRFTTVSTIDEVRQICELQAADLPSVLSPERTASEGFVTVRHDLGVPCSRLAPAIRSVDCQQL